MRFREILKEYNQAKTAQVFGNKLVAALASDNSSHFQAPLGTCRNYLRQKDKIGSEVDEQNKQIIIKDILTAIEQADPTPNKEYTQWLAKCYANEAQKIEDITSKGTDWLKTYHQFKVKKILPDNLRNIANFKFSQLYDIIANDELNAKLDAIENAPSKDKGTAQVVFDNSLVRIIVPNDEAAACYYGQGTRWCTAARANNMYDNYARDGDLYILLPKQPKYDGEKYQLHFASGQFMDEGDSPISDMIALLTGRFGDDVMTFFFNKEPMIKQWIVVTPAEILQPLIDQIAELALEHIHEQLTEWEMEDDHWYNELIAQGYTDENGDLDMDKAEAAGMNWLDSNYDTKNWYDKAVDAVKPSIDRLRDKAQEWADENGEECTLHQLDALVGSIVKEEFMTRRGQLEDGGLSEWMEKHIAVRASTPSQQAAGDPQWKAEYFKGQ